MLPGIPSIYYGDEIGMQGYEDPLNRLPMRWDDVDEELLAYYRRLAQIRTSHRPQVTGDIDVMERKNLLVLTRTARVRSLILVCNNSYEPISLEAFSSSTDLLTGGSIDALGPFEAAIFEGIREK